MTEPFEKAIGHLQEIIYLLPKIPGAELWKLKKELLYVAKLARECFEPHAEYNYEEIHD